MEIFIRLVVTIVGCQIVAFSALLVSEGHVGFVLGPILGTALVIMAALWPILTRSGNVCHNGGTNNDQEV